MRALALFLSIGAFLVISADAFKCSLPSGIRKVVRAKAATMQVTALDVNALPDSKRRLYEISVKLEENLSPNVINFDHLVGSAFDLEHATSQIGFWDDPDKAQLVLAELNNVRATLSRVKNWKVKVDDINTLIEMAGQKDVAGKFVCKYMYRYSTRIRINLSFL